MLLYLYLSVMLLGNSYIFCYNSKHINNTSATVYTTNNAIINEMLLTAAACGQPQQVQQLLHSGANPKATNTCGITALMFAAMSGCALKLALLLNALNHDPDAINAEEPDTKHTALDKAYLFKAIHENSNATKYNEVIELLLNSGARSTQERNR